MSEAELSADLMMALIAGVQTNKNVEQYYVRYEDNSGNLDDAGIKYDLIMSYIGAIYPPEEISQTNWSRIQLFYTLFTSIGHLLYGLKKYPSPVKSEDNGQSGGEAKGSTGRDQAPDMMRGAAANMDSEDSPSDYKIFINFSRRGTTDTGARVGRANFLCEKLKTILD